VPYTNKLDQKKNHAKWRKNNPEKLKANRKRDYQKNKKKRIAVSRKWKQKNLERVKRVASLNRQRNRKKLSARNRLWRHSLSQIRHDNLLKKQQNCCAVCRKKFWETPDIDHDHKTKKVRGLLCTNCNLGLGHFKDSVKILQMAIRYLNQGNR
jgi:Recombination endonuclease VII